MCHKSEVWLSHTEIIVELTNIQIWTDEVMQEAWKHTNRYFLSWEESDSSRSGFDSVSQIGTGSFQLHAKRCEDHSEL